MMTLRLVIVVTAFVLPLFLVPAARAEPWKFKDEFFPELVKALPKILEAQDAKTGQFGTGIWIVTEQNVVFSLAVAWATERADNPYFHDAKLLDAIMLAGDALVKDQDETGQWEFRKEDGSTWGQIYMPWTYSRWIRAFSLIKEAMPADRRATWEKALTLGFEGIAKKELETMHNIPAHHAMGLYCAGKALNRPEWCEQASTFMQKVVSSQDPGGFWSENLGPVVGYNFVYTDALGIYCAMSGDERVVPALERAAQFHANFTYPDGTSVETVDERQVYSADAFVPNLGFTYTPIGRAFLKEQWERRKAGNGTIPADSAASHFMYGREGELQPAESAGERGMFVLGKGDAMTRRVKPWFTCLSAYHAPVPPGRWIQDRQNLVSLFHDDVGLILGGGNTKLQPLWSTFTVGDVSLLKHKPGDEDPDFSPPIGIEHTPSNATLDADATTLHLVYGSVKTHVSVEMAPSGAKLIYGLDSKTTQRVAGHVQLMPRMGKAWSTAAGKSGTLSDEAITLKSGEAGAWVQLDRVRVALPTDAEIAWPVLPHNQYRKDGHAEPKEGRVVISLPLSNESPTSELVFLVVPLDGAP